ncbi:undecaprenyl-diphosphatase [Prauserella rugosa]|uniref:Undecaprenyl-diphosphatase n=1 Tax=Prauserella rugosa TaxID=43354 RepID=A0A660C4L7_9PSEU|nr:undecaprenyl-diphosphatase [Prauserella rugosa]
MHSRPSSDDVSEQPSDHASEPVRARPRGVLLVSATLLLAFVVLGLLARNGTDLDVLVSDRLHDVWRGPAGRAAEITSWVLGPVLPVLAAVGLAVAAFADRRRRPHRARLLGRVLLVLVVCRATSAVAKPLFARDRPREYPDFAFPSGHVTSVAATCFAAVLLVGWLAPRLWHTALAAAVSATALCAASRVVLDVHWLTDTVGAVLGVTGAGLATAAALRLIPLPRRRAGVESAP